MHNGIDLGPASPAPHEGWDVYQGPPRLKKTKTLMGCYGMGSVLVTEGNFLRDMGETCLIITGDRLTSNGVTKIYLR